MSTSVDGCRAVAAGEAEGWARLAKSLRAEIDESAIEKYRGTVSLPFEGKPGQKVAVKVVDDRGIESLRILELDSANAT